MVADFRVCRIRGQESVHIAGVVRFQLNIHQLPRVNRHRVHAGGPVEHLTVWLSPERSRIVTALQLNDVDSLRTGRVVHDREAPGH